MDRVKDREKGKGRWSTGEGRDRTEWRKGTRQAGTQEMVAEPGQQRVGRGVQGRGDTGGKESQEKGERK